MIEEWHSARECADAYGMSKPGFIKLAARKGIRTRRRAGKGGGLEYCFGDHPPNIQLVLAKAESQKLLAETPFPPALESVRNQKKPQEDPAAVAAARAEGDAKAATLAGKPRARMDARAEILRRFERYTKEDAPIAGVRKPGGLIHRAAFAAAWNRGEIDSPARADYPRLSDQQLDRWSQQLRRAGLARLAGNYGNRKNTGVIETHPQLAAALRGLLLDHPHLQPAHAHAWLNARYAALPAAVAGDGPIPLPGHKTVERWLNRWKAENAELYTRMRNPDEWKNKYMVGWGDAAAGIVRLNQVWEFDSTPADVLLEDGRHSILGVIDVYSRRVRLHVSRTSKATAVASLLRGALLDWGVPEIAKTDNGQEYVSNHVRRIFQALDVDHWCSEPFSPWQKSFIERFFRSFSHDLLEYLPGFVGHNVAEREALRARQQFSDRLFVKNRTVELALTAEALQEFCDRWVAGYHSRPHGALAGKRPVEMLAGWRQPVRAVGNERALDLLLSEAPGDGWRIVSKASGIRLNGYDYLAPELGRCVGERVRVLFDPEGDLGRLYTFDGKGQFIALAECPELAGVDRKALAAAGKALQKQRLREQMEGLRADAKAAGSKDLLERVLNHRESDARKIVPLPPRAEECGSAGLIGAQHALDAGQPRTAAIVPPEQLERLRDQMAREERERERIAERPDFASPFARVNWIFEQILRGRWALTQVPAEDRAFARAYLKNTANHKALDYLEMYPRYWEVKSDLMREEDPAETGCPNSESAAG